MASNEQLRQEITSHSSMSTGSPIRSSSFKPIPPERFDGSPSFVTRLTSWIEEVKHYMKLIAANSSNEMDIFISLLTKQASEWYFNVLLKQYGRPPNLDVLVGELIRYFRPLNQSDLAYEKLKMLRVTESMSLNSYTTTFSTLASQIGFINDEFKMKIYKDGLPSGLVEKLIMKEPFNNIYDMINWASYFDAQYQSSKAKRGNNYNVKKNKSNSSSSSRDKPPFHNSTSNSTGAPYRKLNAISTNDQPDTSSNQDTPTTDAQLAAFQQQNGKLTDEERKRCFELKLCFRCRQPGHMKRDCPRNVHDAMKRGNSGGKVQSSNLN